MMRRVIINAVIIFICYILQTSVFEMFRLADVVPNVLLILVSSTAMMRGQKEGMLVGFFSGLMLDVLYSPYLGLNAFLYMLLGFTGGYFQKVYYDNAVLLTAVLIGIQDVIYGVLMYIVMGVLQGHLHIWNYFSKIIIPEAVYTMGIGIILYAILLRVNRWLEKHEKGSVDFV